MSIINNSYAIGADGKNLVLKTSGHLYIKVQEKYYELNFKNPVKEEVKEEVEEDFSKLIIIDEVNNLKTLEYPGNNKLIVSLDGNIFVTKDGLFKNIVSKEQTVNSEISKTISISDLELSGKLEGDSLTLDFDSGHISAKTISAEKSEDELSKNKGLGTTVYFGPELSIDNFNYSPKILEDSILLYQKQYISFLYQIKYLSNNKTIDFWYKLLLNEDGSIKKFESDEFIKEANTALLTSQDNTDLDIVNKDITHYKIAYENLPNKEILSECTGQIVNFFTKDVNRADIIAPNSLVTDENNYFIGRILCVSDEMVTVVIKSGNLQFPKKLIVAESWISTLGNKSVWNKVKNCSKTKAYIHDYTDKEFVEIVDDIGYMRIQSGAIAKSSIHCLMTFFIGEKSIQIDLYPGDLYILYLDGELTYTKLL